MKAAWIVLSVVMAVPARGATASSTPAQLRSHLEKLKTLVAACEQKPTAAMCNEADVGPDDMVALPDGARLVRYDWLRATLLAAGKAKKPLPDLGAANERLNRELKELTDSGQPEVPKAELSSDRKKLNAILTDGDFPPPRNESVWARMWYAFLIWLNAMLDQVGGNGTHTNWAAITLTAAAILAACGGLVWWFRRVTRSHYVLPDAMMRRGVHEDRLADWREWLSEAQALAAEGRWQESIHRLYWAAVAQLEQQGMWRHDAARTPREYLRLLAAESSMRGDLARLTRSLEVFWYAGRQARQEDYDEARAVLDRLVKA